MTNATASRSTESIRVAPSTATMPKPRLVVGDELRIFTEGLARLLGDDFEITSTSEGTHALLAALRRLRPDVAMNGLTYNAARGLGVVRDMHAASPHTGIVVVTQWLDPSIAAEAFRCGASAYVLQTCSPPELVDAVRAALGHKSYVTPVLTSASIQSLLTETRDKNRQAVLTARQRAVVKELADGKSMKEAAASLGMTTRTVAFHKYRVMRTLSIKSSAELVRFAIKSGIA
jgi:DNA-binding NarL/FixJ family response regulator